jgi:leader peptidase (prepilin peptidase)/N-methyltransferase
MTGAELTGLTIVLSAFVAMLGLAVGSFLNVVVHRVPLGMSVVRPHSSCPTCRTQIRARDNVPVLSWLLLRGKCRTCDTRISARYPAVEFLTAAAFLGLWLFFAPRIAGAPSLSAGLGETAVAIAFLYLAAISIALASIDLETRRLPNRIVLPAYLVGGALLGAGAALTGDVKSLEWAAVGAVGSFSFYLILAVIKPGGMGMGDVKLSGVLGLFLGYLGVGPLAVGLFAAFLLGGLAGILLLLTRAGGRRTAIPFGPWMLAGAWTGILAGDELATGYLTLTGII